MKNIIVFSLFLAVLGLFGCSEKTEDKIKQKGEDLKESAKDIYKDLKSGDSTEKAEGKDSAGGTKESDVKGTKYVCMLSGANDSKVKGTLYLYQDGDDIMIEGEITGLAEGRHGFHIHEKGVCEGDFKSAGNHYNPTNKDHGDMSASSHLGDLGNIKANNDGVAKVDIKLDMDTWKIDGSNSIVGKSMVVHDKEDDLKTQPAGDSGDRIACGVIKASR